MSMVLKVRCLVLASQSSVIIALDAWVAVPKSGVCTADLLFTKP